jgi:hypothetical protein
MALKPMLGRDCHHAVGEVTLDVVRSAPAEEASWN